jgi:putative flippase GtrA
MLLVRFLFSGLLNTGIVYLLYLGFLRIYSYHIAYTGSFVLGILISYGLNAKFVFRSSIAFGSLIRFFAVYLTQYVLGLVLLVILIDFFKIAAWIAPIFTLLITVPLTFVLSRTIFLSKKTEVDNAIE